MKKEEEQKRVTTTLPPVKKAMSPITRAILSAAPEDQIDAAEYLMGVGVEQRLERLKE